MHKIFLPIYRFFKAHKPLMFMVLTALSAVLVLFALKMKYEENLLNLFPIEDQESRLAFDNLKVKDKLIIQVVPTGEALDTQTLADYMDEYVEGALLRDTSYHLIETVLYRLEDDMVVNALGFALGHVPSFVDTSCYAAIDEATRPAAIAKQMARNREILDEDETGEMYQMVATDPLGLLPIVGKALVGDGAAPAGLSFADGHLFSRDSTIAVAFISANFNSMDSGTGEKLITELEKEAAVFTQNHPDARILFHGTVAYGTSHSRTIKKDLLSTVSVSLLIIIIILLVSFRSGKILWQNILPVAFGAVFALALMYFTKGGMSLMALGVSAIILGIALSYCMHVTIHFNYVQSPSAVLKDESTPVTLGCVTTVGAFLGLMFTESDLLHDFGLFASFALIGSTLFALIFLPHMLKPGKREVNKKVFGFINRMSEYPFDSKPWILVAVVLFVAVGIFFSPRVQFDPDMRHLNYLTKEVIESQTLYQDKNFAGNYELYYASLGQTPDDAVLSARRLCGKLDSLKAEGRLYDYSGTVSKAYCTVAEQEERIAAWEAYWTPEKVNRTMADIRTAAAAYGLKGDFFSPFRAVLEESYQSESIYDADVIPHNLLDNYIEKTPDGKYMAFTSVQLNFDTQDVVTRAVTKLPHTIVLDPMWYCQDIVNMVHNDFNVALLISSLFVLLILLVSFRNLWIALIAFMPMALSWYVVEGMMALLGIQFNLINIVISTFIFGVGVDYSIFVMEGLLGEVRHGDKSLLAYHKTAIFFSALVLIIVVVSLMFAKHPAISSIGTSTLIGMVTTIAITYTLEPWLFRQLLKRPYFRRSFKAKDAEKE